MHRRLVMGIEFLALAVAAGIGLTWALPAAGIGLMLGFVLVMYELQGGLLGRSALALFGRPDERAALGVVLRPVWIVLVTGGCAIVAVIGVRDGLGQGLSFLPAIVPFLFLMLAVPAVFRQGRRRDRAADGRASDAADRVAGDR